MILKQNSSVPQAVAELNQATRILNVTEFRLLELAYRDWFGETASEALLEAAFMTYLAEDELPVWARNYVRKTLQLCDEAGCYVPKMVTSEAVHINPLMSTDLWILLTGAFLITLLLA